MPLKSEWCFQLTAQQEIRVMKKRKRDLYVKNS